MRASLKMIANELGVSVATVSLVLNGKAGNGRVSKETAEKVLKKAKELNYAPNNFGQGLKIGKSKTIGLIVADISNVFFGTLALHIQNYAQEEGYTIVIGNTNEQLSEMKRMIQVLKSRQVDGLIITPTGKSEELIGQLVNYNIPLVLVDRSFSNIGVSSILINNYEISYKATEHLIAQNCKNIGLITYKKDHYHINERRRGWEEALKKAGIYHPENIKEVSHETLDKDVELSINELIGSREKVDGIFFVTNSISMQGVKNLVKHNIDLKRDIKLMCFDESEAFYILPYHISFIKQPIEKMAYLAMKQLVDAINNPKYQNKQYIINADLIT